MPNKIGKIKIGGFSRIKMDVDYKLLVCSGSDRLPLQISNWEGTILISYLSDLVSSIVFFAFAVQEIFEKSNGLKIQ